MTSSSLWSEEGDISIFGSGLSCIAPSGLTFPQLAAYMIQMRLDEINRQLRLPSRPEYATDPSDAVWRARLQEERSNLIEKALKSNAEMFASLSATSCTSSTIPGVPANCRFAEKIYLPARDYPDINFVGLLIGPRGNTLRRMENETGAKLSIRGQGAQKPEGAAQGRPQDPAMLAAADEELHAVVMADTQERFDKAVALINRIIETACSLPAEANELKKQQLLELAQLNTPASTTAILLGDNAQQPCPQCGQHGHSRFECKQPQALANRLLCRICGGAGHIASDCVYRNDPDMLAESMHRADAIDAEYAAFMAEINAEGTAQGKSDMPDSSDLEALKASAPWATGLQADD